jgi:uncharacterized protein
MPEPGPKEATAIVATAGGEVLGRTRLQKIACLMELAGARIGFKFSYHLYGPYSEQLSLATADAGALRMIEVEERVAEWGGQYSIYRTQQQVGMPDSLRQLATTAAHADSIDLELAVTAAFLAKCGVNDPWGEVTSRKKTKATPERITSARALYQSLKVPNLPIALPNI